MKLDTLDINIERSETFSESNFGIKSNEDLVHIFSVLRNKIYSDKILAVMREYATNAADAHIEAGKHDLPISIHLPNLLEPYFSIRDFGEGLSEDDIRNTYAMYGSSTKRNSNKLNGQLGFGCKSAFSYTDSFQITSINDGIKTIYDAYIDETGLGAIAKLSSSLCTDEGSGLEVTIPVSVSDIDSFRNKGQQLYSFFNIRPNVIGNKDFKFIEPDKDFGHYKIYTKLRDSSMYARMGNVAYPIVNTDQNRLVSYNTSILIDFNIGELSIAASRESLEYTPKTEAAIAAKIAAIKIDLESDFRKELMASKDLIAYTSNLFLIKAIFNINLALPTLNEVVPNSIYDAKYTVMENNLLTMATNKSVFTDNAINLITYATSTYRLSTDYNVAISNDLKSSTYLLHNMYSNLLSYHKNPIVVAYYQEDKKIPISSKEVRKLLDAAMSKHTGKPHGNSASAFFIIHDKSKHIIDAALKELSIDPTRAIDLKTLCPDIVAKKATRIRKPNTPKIKLLDDNFTSISANLANTDIVFRMATSDKSRRYSGLQKFECEKIKNWVSFFNTHAQNAKMNLYFTQKNIDDLLTKKTSGFQNYQHPQLAFSKFIENEPSLKLTFALSQMVEYHTDKAIKIVQKVNPAFFSNEDFKALETALAIRNGTGSTSFYSLVGDFILSIKSDQALKTKAEIIINKLKNLLPLMPYIDSAPENIYTEYVTSCISQSSLNNVPQEVI